MATILPQPVGKTKTKHRPVKIDMTPMVDLGFLLITFFIFTTSLTQPHVARLTMPKEDGIIDDMPVYEKTLLTFVLDKDKAFAYEGAFEKAIAQNKLTPTNYNVQTGIGQQVRNKQKALAADGMKDDLMVLLKPLPSASYQDVMNALDEMLINGIHHYAIVPLSPIEKEQLAQRGVKPE